MVKTSNTSITAKKVGDIGVSVVMPVRNGGFYLRHSVNSILNQCHEKLELLIINDNSSDLALEWLASSNHDKRIRIIDSPGEGIIDALNFGIDSATHSVIARMDCDDISQSNRLTTQLTYMVDNPSIDIIGSTISLFKDHKEIGQGYKLYQNWINSLCDQNSIANNIFIESPIAHPSAMFTKQIIRELGGYQDQGWPEDYDLWCRAYLKGMKFGKPQSNPLVQWRDHEQRTSRQDERYNPSGFLNCKAHYLSQFLHAKGINQCSIWGAGRVGAKLHDLLEANKLLISHFYDVNPKLLGTTKKGKPIHLISSNQTLTPPKPGQGVCIIAVGSRGAREKIQRFLQRNAWRVQEHYILAA